MAEGLVEIGIVVTADSANATLQLKNLTTTEESLIQVTKQLVKQISELQKEKASLIASTMEEVNATKAADAATAKYQRQLQELLGYSEQMKVAVAAQTGAMKGASWASLEAADAAAKQVDALRAQAAAEKEATVAAARQASTMKVVAAEINAGLAEEAKAQKIVEAQRKSATAELESDLNRQARSREAMQAKMAAIDAQVTAQEARDWDKRVLAEKTALAKEVADQEEASAAKIAGRNKFFNDLGTVGSKFRQVGAAGTIYATLPIAAAETFSYKEAAEFEQKLVRIKTLANATTEELGKFGPAIKSMAMETGNDPTKLAEALFHVSSEGHHGAEALDILRVSAKMSAIGMGETKDMAKALVFAMHDYAGSNLTASEAANALVKVIKLGNIDIDTLVGGLGKLLPFGAQMKVPFEQLAGALALLTREGVPANQAITELERVLSTLAHPGRGVVDELHAIAVHAHDSRLELAGLQHGVQTDLLGTLTRLKTATESNSTALGKVFPNIRAFLGAIGIVGQSSKESKEIMDQFAKSTDTLGDAFEETAKTKSFHLQQAWEHLKVAAIDLGDAATPVIESITKKVSDLADQFDKLTPAEKRSYAEMAAWVAITPIAITGLSLLANSVSGLYKLFGLMGSAIAGTTGTLEVLLATIGGGSAALGLLVTAGTVGVAGAAVYGANQLKAENDQQYADAQVDYQVNENNQERRARAYIKEHGLKAALKYAGTPDVGFDVDVAKRIGDKIEASEEAHAANATFEATEGRRFKGSHPLPMVGPIGVDLNNGKPVSTWHDPVKEKKHKLTDEEKEAKRAAAEAERNAQALTDKIQSLATAYRLLGNDSNVAALIQERLTGEYAKQADQLKGVKDLVAEVSQKRIITEKGMSAQLPDAHKEVAAKFDKRMGPGYFGAMPENLRQLAILQQASEDKQKALDQKKRMDEVEKKSIEEQKQGLKDLVEQIKDEAKAWQEARKAMDEYNKEVQKGQQAMREQKADAREGLNQRKSDADFDNQQRFNKLIGVSSRRLFIAEQMRRLGPEISKAEPFEGGPVHNKVEKQLGQEFDKNDRLDQYEKQTQVIQDAKRARDELTMSTKQLADAELQEKGATMQEIVQLDLYNEQTKKLSEWKTEVKTLSEGAAQSFTGALEKMHGSSRKFLAALVQDFGHFAASQGFKVIENQLEGAFTKAIGNRGKPKLDAQLPQVQATTALTTATTTLTTTNTTLISTVQQLIYTIQSQGGSGGGGGLLGMLTPSGRPGGTGGVSGIGSPGSINSEGSTD